MAESMICRELPSWAGYPIRLKPAVPKAFDLLEPGTLMLLPRRHPDDPRPVRDPMTNKLVADLRRVTDLVLFQVLEIPLRDPAVIASLPPIYNNYTSHNGRRIDSMGLIYNFSTGKRRLIGRHPLAGLFLYQDAWRLPLRRKPVLWLDAPFTGRYS
jgi:hypothetical protein